VGGGGRGSGLSACAEACCRAKNCDWCAAGASLQKLKLPTGYPTLKPVANSRLYGRDFNQMCARTRPSRDARRSPLYGNEMARLHKKQITSKGNLRPKVPAIPRLRRTSRARTTRVLGTPHCAPAWAPHIAAPMHARGPTTSAVPVGCRAPGLPTSRSEKRRACPPAWP